MNEQDQVTQFLDAAVRGESCDASDILPLVYDQMHEIAQHFMRHQSPGHTLGATALAHEAYLKLAASDSSHWKGRAHFMAVASKAMRQILINNANAASTQKRGGGWKRVTLSEACTIIDESEIDIVELHNALAELESVDERQARIVELRFFGGLTNDEVAFILDISPRTVQLDWRMARAWLRRAIEESN